MGKNTICEKLNAEVVGGGICVQCGACVGIAPAGEARLVRRCGRLEPEFDSTCVLPEIVWEACPGKGVNYPELYRWHFGSLPSDWLVGHVHKLWTGYATDPLIRRSGASGGVMTAVLIYLLESGLIDGAIVAKQGRPSPEEASWFIARNSEDILSCAQSIYIQVPMLEALAHLQEGEKYAITCVPEQSAALRVLQRAGHQMALQVVYVLGPYTGTCLEVTAIRGLLRANAVKNNDPITSLKWRAGEWPGYLQILTESGRDIRSKKVYYNFLIPFYITQASLQSMDFANEFTDLSVGDAWSPLFEGRGEGFSVVASRSIKMSEILIKMTSQGLLELQGADVLEASAMHGHMIDFKKRGGYLRNRWRLLTRRRAPDYGLFPESVGISRILVEIVISSIFTFGRTGPARWFMEQIPEWVLGPVFNRMRLVWKSASKPAKRKGLRDLKMAVRTPKWMDDLR